MAATLDGVVEPGGAVFEAKFMLPWSFSELAAAEKHMAQLQHNMAVVQTRTAILSIITGGGKWVESPYWQIPSTSTFSRMPRRASGLAWRAASSLACSAPNRHARVLRRSAAWT